LSAPKNKGVSCREKTNVIRAGFNPGLHEPDKIRLEIDIDVLMDQLELMNRLGFAGRTGGQVLAEVFIVKMHKNHPAFL
jgi:hypothetical protein